MVSGRSLFHRMATARHRAPVHVKILDSKGTVVGCVTVHAARQENGFVRTQLELRFEDKPSAFISAAAQLAAGRYEAGWTGVLVEMEPRQSNTEPMRLCLSIPVQTGVSGDYAGNGKATSIGM